MIWLDPTVFHPLGYLEVMAVVDLSILLGCLGTETLKRMFQRWPLILEFFLEVSV